MSKVAIVTDSNSGITQSQALAFGIRVLPMPFYINEKMYYEDIDLSQEQFYQMLASGANISTSQPVVANVLDLWDELLTSYDQVVHIPMSSGLSGSCETATALAVDYDGRVEVVNNQRISVTQRQSVLDALKLAGEGKSAQEIKKILEDTKYDSSIYIMVNTLDYLKKGGRITPTAAAIGTLLKLKPVLQIQGEKLDAYAKARSVKQAKSLMIKAMQHDFVERFGSDEQGTGMYLQLAYTGDRGEAERFYQEVRQIFPKQDIVMDPLSLSVSCHIGPGALAVACTKKLW
ncbi:DegV family protein [Cuneatibacter sp. NSJ-177]|jgi:DegV family protein with EDD domain|uniref:DegV family protein n=1 Tax=Cuneatibacter sp. NSJ-177 TaxID=2931401 RepID=UPI001FD33867|nr:DegV family protein [Cuneatibacter sp. NSJ-177]MCJ7836835.1 DegV family protein [Cuneatibacter sp. NSJ-177]